MKSTNKVWQLINDLGKKAGISEIIINRADAVFVEVQGEIIRLDYSFTDNEIDEFVKDVAEFNRRNFGPEAPILDGNIPDGSRINIISKDYSKVSHSITIRRYSRSIKSFDGSPGIFGLTPQMVTLLKAMIRARFNIVVAGGTGVGKTTFMNLMLQEISPKDRIITIEDTRELQLNQPNVVRLEAKPSFGEMVGLTQRDLVKNTLRMRPDRIVVGEVRGAEAFDLLQAMNTGHEGTMTSLHANSPGECMIRLENLFMLAGYDLPMKALRYQISEAIDFVVQIKRDKNGTRSVTQITEVTGMEGERVTMQDLAATKNGEFKLTGLVPASFERLIESGISREFFTNT
jgi:pilus assembly protein CpaF